MSDAPQRSRLASAQKLHESVSRYREDSLAGRNQQIEDYLAKADESDRKPLLQSLLAIEKELCQRAGRPLDMQRCLQRFPGHVDVVHAVFGQVPAPAQTPPAALVVRSPNMVEPARVVKSPKVVEPARAGAVPQPPRIEPKLHAPGQSLGRFEIRAALGTGAHGAVFRAFDPVLCREVALKVPHAALQADPGSRTRFQRESQAAAQLRHPNIVPVFDARFDRETQYIASAYVEGQTLAAVVESSRLDFRRSAAIVRDLALALGYAHALGVVHRDVKCANIMLATDGTPLIMDFGLAQVGNATDQGPAENTLQGTPAYMSPEQASRDFGGIGPASDQYSLGVVLYELLCAQRPFSGPPAAVLHNVIHQPATAPRAIDSSIPADLETICLKAINKRAADRYSDCLAFAEDLRRWLEDEEILARRASPLTRLRRWTRKNPLPARLVITSLTLAVLCMLAAIGLVALRGVANAQWTLQKSHQGRSLLLLADKRKQSAAREKAQGTLAERQAEVARYEQQIAADREQLKLRDRDLAGQERMLHVWEDELTRLEESITRAQQLAKDRQTQAQTAAETEQSFSATSAWPAYVEKLALAQTALAESDFPEAIALLEDCPPELRAWEWNWLKAQCEPGNFYHWDQTDPRTVNPDQLAISPDGNWLAVVERRGVRRSLKLLDAATGKLRVDAGGSDVTCVAFDPTGRMLAASDDGVLHTWRMPADPVSLPELVTTHPRNRSRVFAIAFSTDGTEIAVVDGHGSVSLQSSTQPVRVGGPWLIPGEEREDFLHSSVAFAGPRDQLIALPAFRLGAIIHLTGEKPAAKDVRGMQAKASLLTIQLGHSNHKFVASSWAIQPDGALFIAGNGTIIDVTTGDPIGQLDLDGQSPLGFTPDGQRLICANENGLSLYTTNNLQSNSTLKTMDLAGPLAKMGYARISANGRRVVALTLKGQVVSSGQIEGDHAP